jgi:NADPH:quinone reductase-like Zn-dependent oxidoreductase
MKAVRIHEFGGAEAMRLDSIETPKPASGEILVLVKAASLNPVDYKTCEGKFPPVSRDKLPIVLGRDLAGIVDQVGPDVGTYLPGDSIYAMLAPDRGTFAEYAIVKAWEAAPQPARLNYAEAAAVPLAALTAWQGLVDHGGLTAGQRVLIHGGAGGVGHFAVQIAKVKGASVFTTVSGGDIEFADALGAERAIDSEREKFEDVAHDIDLVFDLVAGDTQARSWRVLKRGGILVSTLGEPSQEMARKHGVRAAGFMAQPNGAQLAEIGHLIDQGAIRPVVEKLFPFAAASDAESRLQHEHGRGKIVLEIAAAQ